LVVTLFYNNFDTLGLFGSGYAYAGKNRYF
jgi:hypothetical protein